MAWVQPFYMDNLRWIEGGMKESADQISDLVVGLSKKCIGVR